MSIRQNKYSKHTFFMKLALMQAQKNLGNTKKNPAVGCIIVNNDRVIATGCTGLSGKPHAELNAIKFSSESIKNSSLYVTLEPCSHYGKTPPCVNAIIKGRVNRVFFSIKDPDLRSYDKCTTKFKGEGINVKHNVLKDKVNFFYRSYSKFKKEELPFVTCKLAISRDFYSINKTFEKIKEVDTAFILIDALKGLAKQDKRIILDKIIGKKI